MFKIMKWNYVQTSLVLQRNQCIVVNRSREMKLPTGKIFDFNSA